MFSIIHNPPTHFEPVPSTVLCVSAAAVE